MGLPGSGGFSPENKQSVLLGFFPSEFSGLRMQVDRLEQTDGPTGYALAFQYNITIGAHPAHSY